MKITDISVDLYSAAEQNVLLKLKFLNSKTRHITYVTFRLK